MLAHFENRLNQLNMQIVKMVNCKFSLQSSFLSIFLLIFRIFLSEYFCCCTSECTCADCRTVGQSVWMCVRAVVYIEEINSVHLILN